MHVGEGAEKAFTLVVLLEESLAETALPGGQIEQFTVVERAIETLGQLPGNHPAARTDLPADVDNDVLLIHDLRI